MVSLNVNLKKFLKVYIIELLFITLIYYLSKGMTKVLIKQVSKTKQILTGLQNSLNISNLPSSAHLNNFLISIVFYPFIFILLLAIFYVISRKYIYNIIASTRKRLGSYFAISLIIFSILLLFISPLFLVIIVLIRNKVILAIVLFLLYIFILNLIYSLYILTAKYGSIRSFIELQSRFIKRINDYFIITLVIFVLYFLLGILTAKSHNLIKTLTLLFIFTYHKFLVYNVLNRKIVRIKNKKSKTKKTKS